jgi:hypothetical protein
MGVLYFRCVNQHEVYSCLLNPYKNIFNIFSLTQLKFAITCKQNNFNDLVLLMSVIKLLLNEKPYFEIKDFNLTKKIVIQSSYTKLKSILLFNNFIFNFIFFNQQKFLFVNTIKSFLFAHFDILTFNFFSKFYKFVCNVPKIHFSFKFDIFNVNDKFVARILRIPVFS